MGVKLFELRIGGCPVVLGCTQRSAEVNVGAEVTDNVLIEDRDVTLGGIDVLVA